MARVKKQDLAKEIMRLMRECLDQLAVLENRLTATEKAMNHAPISKVRAKPKAKVLPFRLREQRTAQL